MRTTLSIISFLMCLVPNITHGQEESKYIIIANIGDYEFSGNSFEEGHDRPIYFKDAWLLSGYDHYGKDNSHITYEALYFNRKSNIGAAVHVTQHADSESEKWLSHDLERSLCKPKSWGSIYSSTNPLQEFNGSKVFSRGISSYFWLSKYVVVSVEGSKKIVLAYLKKFPSTLPVNLSLNDAHKITWIKEEIEHQLWLFEKRLNGYEHGNIQKKIDLLGAAHHFGALRSFREKYFGIKNEYGERQQIYNDLENGNIDSALIKLKEYKEWWAIHKGDAIHL